MVDKKSATYLSSYLESPFNPNLLYNSCFMQQSPFYILTFIAEIRIRSPNAFLNNSSRILFAVFVPMPPIGFWTFNILVHINRQTILYQ